MRAELQRLKRDTDTFRVTGQLEISGTVFTRMYRGPARGLEVACALLAKEWGRRQWLWFLLGFFFTFIAVLALVFFKTWDRDTKARE
jgi:hypothetical protein